MGVITVYYGVHTAFHGLLRCITVYYDANTVILRNITMTMKSITVQIVEKEG